MASCDYCGSTILFGGIRLGDLRFCNASCQQQGAILEVADQLHEDVVAQHVREVHEGDCPRCGGPGPVDVHTSHSVWSAMVLTSWKSKPEICCRSCGTKRRLGAVASSAVLGWWGFPWGLIMTPIQIARNLGGMLSSSASTGPSGKLENLVRVHLASQLAKSGQGQGAELLE